MVQTQSRPRQATDQGRPHATRRPGADQGRQARRPLESGLRIAQKDENPRRFFPATGQRRLRRQILQDPGQKESLRHRLASEHGPHPGDSRKSDEEDPSASGGREQVTLRAFAWAIAALAMLMYS